VFALTQDLSELSLTAAGVTAMRAATNDAPVSMTGRNVETDGRDIVSKGGTLAPRIQDVADLITEARARRAHETEASRDAGGKPGRVHL
jgi:hypothetical protein